MRKRVLGIFVFAIAIFLGMTGDMSVVHAKESKESGKTFLDMIIDGPEEGTWKDVEELTPGMLGDGIYKVNGLLKNGSGEGKISSTMTMNISAGVARILISWDTHDYEYLKLNDVEYLPLEKEETSVFEIKPDLLNREMELEVGGTDENGSSWSESYILVLDLDSIEKEGMNPRILGMIIGVVVGAAVMFIIIKLDKLHDKKKAAGQKAPAVKNTNKYRK